MRHTKSPRTFIDLFAGCGGLSLGLFEAGWRGLFAVEKEERAFATLAHNLLRNKKHQFAWPTWLPKQAWSLEDFLSKCNVELERLNGRVDLLAGGPPCQGFSSLGRRSNRDPRNQLFRQYLQVVKLVEPNLVLIENVQGICHPFSGIDSHAHLAEPQDSYAAIIVEELEALGYRVWPDLVFAANYGVPQIRPRFLVIAALKNHLRKECPDPFHILESLKPEFLRSKNLNPNKPVTAGEALADLRTRGRLETSPENNRFMQGRYGPQRTAYQKLMHGDLNGQIADSHRLANHRPETVEKFAWFLRHCGPGKKLGPQQRGPYFTKKHIINILHPGRPAPTVTTLPDDLLHYAEPRILTVRENARLQSFPDWFEFQGKYTTGGKERVKQCPRYTQVGNAVPPLLAEAVGRALYDFHENALM